MIFNVELQRKWYKAVVVCSKGLSQNMAEEAE
jgi:hypothetical protein